jgi:hypothetical protein
MEPIHIADRDLTAFLVYAARERALDESQRRANLLSDSADHCTSIDALRELNKRLLFRETRHGRAG